MYDTESQQSRESIFAVTLNCDFLFSFCSNSRCENGAVREAADGEGGTGEQQDETSQDIRITTTARKEIGVEC